MKSVLVVQDITIRVVRQLDPFGLPLPEASALARMAQALEEEPAVVAHRFLDRCSTPIIPEEIGVRQYPSVEVLDHALVEVTVDGEPIFQSQGL